MRTFNEFREKISIAEMAEQLGYWQSSSPREKYLCYSLGDKINPVDEIVIYNQNDSARSTYFSRRNGASDKGNLINFIENRLDKFAHTKSGLAGVNEVLNSYLGSELKVNRPVQTPSSPKENTQFNINYWHPKPLESSNNEYLTTRRKLSAKTIEDFRSKYHIYMVGKSNHIGFPFRKPGQMEITNFEMRNYFPDNNTNFKAFCTGGDKSESCWIGNFVPFNEVTDLYLFESAIDAMSFYELKGFSKTTTAAFISTGGFVTHGQLARLKATFPSVKSWFACFDNDPTGNCFDVILAYALNEKTCKAYAVPEAQGLPSKIVHISHSNGEKESFREADFSSKKYLDDNGLHNIQIIKPSRGKDWNDQLINFKRFDLNLAPTAKINQFIDSCISQLNLRGYHQLTDTILANKNYIIETLFQGSSCKLSAPIFETTQLTLLADCQLDITDYGLSPAVTNIQLIDKNSQKEFSGQRIVEYLKSEKKDLFKDYFAKDVESLIKDSNLTHQIDKPIVEPITVPHISSQELQSLANKYKDLGYNSIASSIKEYIPSRLNSPSSSSFSYTIENVEVSSGGAKVLYGDIIISKGSGEAVASIANYRVKDKTTGLIEALETNGVDICKQPANQVKKLLSGSKVQTSSAAAGITQMLGLNKTPLGWGISIGKQIFNTAESSAGIG